MDEIDLQLALNEFETRLLEDADVPARAALRTLLFGFADVPVEGSIGDVMGILAGFQRPPAGAAALMLRAIARDGFLQDNAANHLARNTVAVAEKSLPGFCSFLKVSQKSQTYEKFEVLRGAKGWIDGRLAPLRVPYTTLESLLAARPTVTNSLAHGRLTEFGEIYRLPEIRDAIESVFTALDNVSKVAVTLAADVEACERAIDDARRLTTRYPSFVTVTSLEPWLQCASERLHKFIDSLRGRFTAVIARDWTGSELPKRYPLLDKGRELRILVPFSSNGRGAATDVRVTVVSDNQQILFMNEEISLGSVSPGKFSVALDVYVVDPCPVVSAMLELEWGEVGTSLRQKDIFEVRALAQASGIDWEAYTYADPYGTGPAEGDAFVGRKEQVQTLGPVSA